MVDTFLRGRRVVEMLLTRNVEGKSLVLICEFQFSANRKRTTSRFALMVFSIGNPERPKVSPLPKSRHLKFPRISLRGGRKDLLGVERMT